MNRLELKKELHNIIDSADEKKLRDIYTAIKSQSEANYDFWESPEFLEELKR